MKTKICVVGAGKWGKNHIRTLAEMNLLGGVVETHGNIRDELKKTFSDAKFYESVNDSLADKYSAYTVATPAESHFRVASELIEAGKHVLVEKPLSLTAQDARKLVALAEKNGVKLMVGHVMLFHPAVRKIKELILEGRLGKLQYLYSNRTNLGTIRKEENILWSFAPHDISIFQYFIGKQPTSVFSRGGAFVQPGVHDSTITLLRYPENIVAHIFVSWLHPFKEHRLVVIGDKGMVSFEDSGSKEILFYEKGVDWIQGEPVKRDGPTETIPYEPSMPLTNELQYFLKCVEGAAVEVADGANGVEVLEILERASRDLIKTSGGVVAAQKDYFVHDTACVDDGATVGNGTKIWHFSHIQSGATIGAECTLGQNVNVANEVTIGDHVKIQNNVSVYQGVELEDYVFCGPSMVFTNIRVPRSKYPQRGAEHYVKTLVKEGASLGANSTIMCGVNIGRHALVGAGAVVTKDVPDYAVMVGNPARLVGWVCECGERLTIEEGDSDKCARCSFSYNLKNGILQRIT